MKPNILTLDFLKAQSVVIDTGCWEWSMGRDRDGYGLVRSFCTTVRVHRAAWEIANGPIPTGNVVCHKCDNPPCCNPAHLFAGSVGDNVRDAFAKGRKSQPSNAHMWKGERVNTAKLTEGDVLAIRASTENATVLAPRYGVAPSAIWNVRTRKTWRHV